MIRPRLRPPSESDDPGKDPARSWGWARFSALITQQVRWVITSVLSRPGALLGGVRRGSTVPAPSKCAES